MKKKLIALAMATAMVTGCSFETIPPVSYGKVVGVDGYLPEILPTGKYTLWGRDEMVVLDGSTKLGRMPLDVTMKDSNPDGSAKFGLDMKHTVKFRYKLKNDPATVNAMFDDIKLPENKFISAESIYGMYGAILIETKSREILSQYTPEEALANRAVVNKALNDAVVAAAKKLPITFSDVSVPSMALPKLIKDRIKTNKDRELKLFEENAKQAIALTKSDNRIALASKRAQKELIDAESLAAQNVALGSSATPQVIRLRELAIQEIYAEAVAVGMENGTNNTTYLPFDALSSVGAQVNMFNTKK